jgi:hypothetical protein
MTANAGTDQKMGGAQNDLAAELFTTILKKEKNS